jgi:hypothetical protein
MMKIIQFIVVAAAAVALAAGCTAQVRKKPVNAVTNGKSDATVVTEHPVIAEGADSGIETPFVFVAREAATYALLRETVGGLPAEPTADFSKHAVVAAFAGTRRTGGYSVKIGSDGARTSIRLIQPPADAMVTQALTTPFTVALVPVEAEDPLKVGFSAEWLNAARTYRVTGGEFGYSGGIAHREKKFAPEGTVRVWQSGTLVTADFELSGKGAEKDLRLAETSSGSLKNEAFSLARLDAGTFSENPKPPMGVTGRLSGTKLTLTFRPLPDNVSDGFTAGGSIEAEEVRAPDSR